MDLLEPFRDYPLSILPIGFHLIEGCMEGTAQDLLIIAILDKEGHIASRNRGRYMVATLL